MQRLKNQQPPDEIRGLIELLIRKATDNKLLLAGVLIQPDREAVPPGVASLTLFGNLNERGYKLAEFHRELAKLIDQKTTSGKMIESPISRVV